MLFPQDIRSETSDQRTLDCSSLAHSAVARMATHVPRPRTEQMNQLHGQEEVGDAKKY
jgi:hypothetical protein